MSVEQNADHKKAPEEAKHITVLRDVISNTTVKDWNPKAQRILEDNLTVFFTAYGKELKGDWSKTNIDQLKVLVGVKSETSPDNKDLLANVRKKIRDTGVGPHSLQGISRTVVTTATMLKFGIETYQDYLELIRGKAERKRKTRYRDRRTGSMQTSTSSLRRF